MDYEDWRKGLPAPPPVDSRDTATRDALKALQRGPAVTPDYVKELDAQAARERAWLLAGAGAGILVAAVAGRALYTRRQAIGAAFGRFLSNQGG